MPNERVFRASFQSRANGSPHHNTMGITIHSEESGRTTQVNFNFTEQQSPHHYPSTADHMQASRKEALTTEHRD